MDEPRVSAVVVVNGAQLCYMTFSSVFTIHNISNPSSALPSFGAFSILMEREDRRRFAEHTSGA